MKVLGIDPGTGRLGWAIVEKTKSGEKLVDSGCVETTANLPLPLRLEIIFNYLMALIQRYSPTDAAIEDLFFAKNQKTVISVGAARGVAILACQLSKLRINNYTPLQVKAAITGYGSADKKQVAYMVKQILKLEELPHLDDTTDAIALALFHLFQARSHIITLNSSR